MAKREKLHTKSPPIYGEIASKQYDDAKHDLSNWAETPGSSRIARYRYDYINRALQVQWRNSKPGYIYLDVPYEVYRIFARLTSKGKAVNQYLNGFEYRQMLPDEASAPSNDQRAPVSRARG